MRAKFLVWEMVLALVERLLVEIISDNVAKKGKYEGFGLGGKSVDSKMEKEVVDNMAELITCVMPGITILRRVERRY